MNRVPEFKVRLGVVTIIVSLLGQTFALAQEQPNRETSSLLEEVVVVARKREESIQDVPLSVSAFNEAQLEALKVRKLDDVAVSMPNVALDDVSTFRGLANFSIRGLGINSSIPSIDPTVGVFVDGVYMGQNAGVVFDMFDIASIEVLRGPQGTLFGRNVTGGAVLINTKKPSEETDVSARFAIDGNPNGDGGTSRYLMAAVSGPLGGDFSGRLSAYQNKDDGWFVNLADGRDFGEADTTIFRPVLHWEPSEDFDATLRWEHMDSKSDGPASQNHINGAGVPGAFATFDRDSFDFAIDEPGLNDVENDLVTLELNWAVAWGDGTITNIFGWRDFQSFGQSDIDAQPVWAFHAPFWNNSEQSSNELRYNGQFDRLNLTAGIFWFTNEINYSERRNLLGLATGGVAPALTQDGGGNYFVDSLAFFTSVDYQLSETWSLTAGIRYTKEDKRVEIASLVRNINSPCNITEGTCPFDFTDSATWNAWSGKLGLGYALDEDRRFYGHWSRAHRSGGYNLRNTAIDTVNLGPGPFDEETVDSFELGYKSELASGGTLNAAVFYTQIDDMQREINQADPIAGIVQVIKNTADANILGFEIDGTFALTEQLVLKASLGWLDPSYSEVRFDLNNDGAIDDLDKALDLPRAAELTWSTALFHEWSLTNGGHLSSRLSYAYRDRSAFTDNNLGYILEQDMLDAGVDYYTPGGRWIISVYGRNLLNSVKHGGDSLLPTLLGGVPVGGTFSPLAKGRVAGLELTFNYP